MASEPLPDHASECTAGGTMKTESSADGLALTHAKLLRDVGDLITAWSGAKGADPRRVTPNGADGESSQTKQCNGDDVPSVGDPK